MFKFKSPSFSGINSSSHYLTIENQEATRKQAIKDEIEAYQDELAREADNTTLARFIRNLESRIYAQISKQLVDNMFGNEEAAYFGTFTLEGNTITYERIESCGEDGACVEIIRLTIVDAEGSTTTIDIPYLAASLIPLSIALKPAICPKALFASKTLTAGNFL